MKLRVQKYKNKDLTTIDQTNDMMMNLTNDQFNDG